MVEILTQSLNINAHHKLDKNDSISINIELTSRNFHILDNGTSECLGFLLCVVITI